MTYVKSVLVVNDLKKIIIIWLPEAYSGPRQIPNIDPCPKIIDILSRWLKQSYY